MTKQQGHILPFFIPHLGCPCHCVFCDQRTISGVIKLPEKAEIIKAMSDNADKKCQLAYYGGSFTAMPADKQLYYLETAKIGIENGWISGIRVSTRPDAINNEIIEMLKKYAVDTVELGVQTMNEASLVASKRGHTASHSINAVKLLKNSGFTVGVQLMPGLPLDNRNSIIAGAVEILSQHPDLLRIYPTVVVAGTELAKLYIKGEYKPLTLNEAVEISAEITLLAEKNGVTVIRTGLNTDDGLEKNIFSGPYHPAFGNLVKGYIWRQKVLYALEQLFAKKADWTRITVYADKSKMPLIFGQNSCNRQFYQEMTANSSFKVKSFNAEINGDAEDIVIVGDDRLHKVFCHSDFVEFYCKKIFAELNNRL